MTIDQSASLGSSREGIPARVLLVEDEELSLHFAHQMLEDAGLTVVPAMSAKSAVDLAQLEHFDLILMDLQLPDFDGFEATRRIRQLQPCGAHPPIVALTATVRAGDRERCQQAGMDGCEAKPLTQELLSRLIAEHLGPVPATAEQAPPALRGERLGPLFRESAARLIAELRNARARGDRDAVLRAAHTLRSASAHAANMPLTQACADLESIADDAHAALEPAIDAVLAAYAVIDHAAVNGAGAAPAPATQSVGPLVLVVDDDANERFLVRRLLELAGYRVHECDCGQAAIDYCRHRLPHAVLLDGRMPGMDGIATCTLLRAECPLDQLPILMYTGVIDPTWRAHALRAGANRFVDKSVGIEELARNLSAALAACGVEARS